MKDRPGRLSRILTAARSASCRARRHCCRTTRAAAAAVSVRRTCGPSSRGTAPRGEAGQLFRGPAAFRADEHRQPIRAAPRSGRVGVSQRGPGRRDRARPRRRTRTERPAAAGQRLGQVQRRFQLRQAAAAALLECRAQDRQPACCLPGPGSMTPRRGQAERSDGPPARRPSPGPIRSACP